MPLIECGFQIEGKADHGLLITYGPTTQVIVCGHEVPSAPNAENYQNVNALIDTGASHSCIDAKLATQLQLNPIDTIQIAGVGGSKKHYLYLAHILIPQLDIVQWGAFAGVDLLDGGQEHGVLLGRDILSRCIMIYDGIRAQITLASPKIS